MGRHAITAVFFCGLVLTVWTKDCPAATQEQALAQARMLAATNRYSEALATLEPLVGDDLSDRTSWEIAAEAGRAAFHLGQYRKAHGLFRRVVQARPIVVEPALYLEATSYVLGDRRQAFAIFEAVLQSQAQDLYLAVTLPGEKRFLDEPRVRELLERHAQPLVVRPESATVQGARLGRERLKIAESLGIEAPPGESTLSARAGPLMTWILSFDDDGLLDEIVLNADHLRRYTPYSLDLSGGISWTSTPIACIGALGGPQRTATTDDGALILTWDFSEASLDLVFSRPNSNDDGAAILEMVRMYRRVKMVR